MAVCFFASGSLRLCVFLLVSVRLSLSLSLCEPRAARRLRSPSPLVPGCVFLKGASFSCEPLIQRERSREKRGPRVFLLSTDPLSLPCALPGVGLSLLHAGPGPRRQCRDAVAPGVPAPGRRKGRLGPLCCVRLGPARGLCAADFLFKRTDRGSAEERGREQQLKGAGAWAGQTVALMPGRWSMPRLKSGTTAAAEVEVGHYASCRGWSARGQRVPRVAMRVQSAAAALSARRFARPRRMLAGVAPGTAASCVLETPARPYSRYVFISQMACSCRAWHSSVVYD